MISRIEKDKQIFNVSLVLARCDKNGLTGVWCQERKSLNVLIAMMNHERMVINNTIIKLVLKISMKGLHVRNNLCCY